MVNFDQFEVTQGVGAARTAGSGAGCLFRRVAKVAATDT